MNLNAVYKQNEACLLEEMEGEILLYNPITATTIHLNASSAIVIELCNGQNTVSEIIAQMQQQFPQQAEQVAEDITKVLEDLSNRNVLEFVSE